MKKADTYKGKGELLTEAFGGETMDELIEQIQSQFQYNPIRAMAVLRRAMERYAIGKSRYEQVACLEKASNNASLKYLEVSGIRTIVVDKESITSKDNLI